MDKKQEHKFPVRFPLTLWEQLNDLARDEERSVNWEIIQAVRERIARKKGEQKHVDDTEDQN